jgi:hypothetical protein
VWTHRWRGVVYGGIGNGSEAAIRKTLLAAPLEKPTNTMVELSLISYTEIN